MAQLELDVLFPKMRCDLGANISPAPFEKLRGHFGVLNSMPAPQSCWACNYETLPTVCAFAANSYLHRSGRHDQTELKHAAGSRDQPTHFWYGSKTP